MDTHLDGGFPKSPPHTESKKIALTFCKGSLAVVELFRGTTSAASPLTVCILVGSELALNDM